MRLQSILPHQVWISPSVHLQISSPSSSHVGLLYGAVLPTHIQITHFLQYPSLQRGELKNWEKSYEKELLNYQDTQKVGWYTKGRKERSFQELQACKNYQKCLEQSFFLMIDTQQQFPYRAHRVKRSFLNRQVFDTKELEKLNPFYELNVRIRGAVDISSEALLSWRPQESQKESGADKLQLMCSYIEATIETKQFPPANQMLIQQQFTQKLKHKLAEKQYRKKLEEEDRREKEAGDLLDDLWDD